MVNSTTMEDDTKVLVTTNVGKIIRVAENTKMVRSSWWRTIPRWWRLPWY